MRSATIQAVASSVGRDGTRPPLFTEPDVESADKTLALAAMSGEQRQTRRSSNDNPLAVLLEKDVLLHLKT